MLCDKNGVAVNGGQNYSLCAEVAMNLRVAPISYEGGMVPVSVLSACLDDASEQELRKTFCVTVEGARVSDVMLYLEMTQQRQLCCESAAQIMAGTATGVVMPWMTAPAL